MAQVRKVKGSEMLAELDFKPYYDGQKLITDNDFLAVTAHGHTLYFKPEDFKSGENVIFMVEKNSDFTEGRGPMRFDSAYYTFDDAVEYILRQDGIYGTPQGVSNRPGINIHGVPYVTSDFNGFNIRPIEVK